MTTSEASSTQPRELIVNWLAVLVLVSLGIVWTPATAAITEPAQARTGSLLLKSGPDEPAIEALRVSTRLRAHVTGTVARVYVTQTFSNPTDDWVEGLYVFPLSATAAVDELEMKIAERTIRGEIKLREEARAAYERARSEGRRASLVEQERPNMFTTSVANIGPQSEIIVEIAYLDTVPYRDERYTLNLPLAITPRYTPGAMLDPAAPLAADRARATNAIFGTTATPERVTSPQQRVDIEVQLAPGFALESVRSLHHAVETSERAAGRRITLKAGSVPADRDFELVWTPVVAPDLQAAAFAERVGDDAYVLVMLTPPKMTDAHPLNREVLFIIDTSGSMGGPSIEQARAALRLGIERLGPGDRFNIIRFSNDASSLFARLEPADATARGLAARFIDSLQASGGTEMRAALDLAFAMPPPQEILRQIVFITDGSVSNERELVKMIHDRIGDARLFTVGIGAAPNAYFMREAAAAGRGSYTFIAQIDQVLERMQDLFRKLEQPALVDLEVRWPGRSEPELASAVPGDVYAGDPLLIAARLPKVPGGLLTLSGRSRGRAWIRQVPLTVVGEHAGLSKLWARERIAGISRQRNFGSDAAAAKAAIVQLSLAHHLVSEFTSLVAVDVTPARPAHLDAQRRQAPTSAPVGSYWARSTGFASTATPAPLWLLAGLLALGVAAMLRVGATRGRLARTARHDADQLVASRRKWWLP